MIDFNSFNEKFTAAATGEYSKYAHLSERFYALTCMLMQANEKTNLTSIRDVDDIILKHYIDCLSIERFIPQNAEMLDVGCGGGFPTLPLAIARDDIRITALDSTAKKLEFVRLAAEKLSLNVTVLAGRAEDLGSGGFKGNGLKKQYREGFSVVTARAVSALNVLSELCLPLTAKGGVFIAMKSSGGGDEYETAKRAVSTLGGKATVYNTTVGEMQRCIIVINKTAKTPAEYPRQYAKIIKSPL